MQTGKPWTGDELMTLRRVFPTQGPTEAALALGRSIYSVRSKARDLMLPGINSTYPIGRKRTPKAKPPEPMPPARRLERCGKGICMHKVEDKGHPPALRNCGKQALLRVITPGILGRCTRVACEACYERHYRQPGDPTWAMLNAILPGVTRILQERSTSGNTGGCEPNLKFDESQLKPPMTEPSEREQRRMSRARQLGDTARKGPVSLWMLEGMGWTRDAVHHILKESPEWIMLKMGEVYLTDKGKEDLRIGDYDKVPHTAGRARRVQVRGIRCG